MEAQYAKPLPIVTADNRAYWAAAKAHRFELPKCRTCGAWIYPIAPLCQRCWSEDIEWAPLSGLGSVSSWVVYHRAFDPSFKDDLPYMVVEIEIDEGVRLISNLVDTEPDAVYRGMRVMVTFDDVTPDITLVKFATA
jgi:uncharacterized OB-fold protein